METETIKAFDSYENGYNSTLGGEGSFGRFWTQEMKDKISQSKIGKSLSDEHKKKLSVLWSGSRNPNYGKKNLSEEHKRRISETQKEKYATGKAIAWSKGLTKETDERVRKRYLKLSQHESTAN